MTSELQVQHSAKLPSPITESIVQSTNLNSFQSWNELVHSGKHKLICELPLFDLLPFLEEFLDIPPDIFKGLFEEGANFNCLLCFLICFLCLWFEDFCRVQICPCLQAEQESKKNYTSFNRYFHVSCFRGFNLDQFCFILLKCPTVKTFTWNFGWLLSHYTLQIYNADHWFSWKQLLP